MSGTANIGEARPWSFDELVAEGLSLVPAYAADWTNHNKSDPGITLVELLAYISEILIYRALRVTPDAKFAFLRLLGYHDEPPLEQLIGKPAHVIEDAIRRRVEEMSQSDNAVTPADFEALAARTLIPHVGEDTRFRVKCLPGVDVRRMMQTRDISLVESPADVSVMIALEQTPDSSIMHDLQEALQQHCLLTTRAHVAPAVELQLSIACRISPQPGVTLAQAIEAADAALQRWFDPLQPSGSADPSPFGRTLHLASVAGVIDRADGVDYVEDVVVDGVAITGLVREDQASIGIRIGRVAHVGEDTRLGGLAGATMRRFRTDESGEAEAIDLHPWEVVRVRLARDAVVRIADDDAFGETQDRPRG